MSHAGPDLRWVPPRHHRARAAFWLVVLGSALCGAIGATLALIAGTTTPPWVVAVYAWTILAALTAAAFSSTGS